MKELLIIPAVIFGFFLLKVVIGLFAPKASGKQLLIKKLKQYGVNVDNIPDEFFVETIEYCYKTAKTIKLFHENESHINLYVDFIEGEAVNIANCLLDKDITDRYKDQRERLKKYNLI